MNVKIVDMLNAVNALGTIMEQRLPARVAHKLVRLARLVNAEIDIFTEAKDAIFKTYAEADSEGKLRVPDKDAEKYREEIDGLLQTEIAFNFDCINIDELGNAEVRPIDLYALQFFMCE